MTDTSKNIKKAFHDCEQRLKSDDNKQMQRKELDLHIFKQTWSTTALGFETFLAGQAFTEADTIVIFGPKKDVCVYFDDGFAYYIENPNSELPSD